MNPGVLAALHGFVAGCLNPAEDQRPIEYRGIVAPIFEEALRSGAQVSGLGSIGAAALFAGLHVVQEPDAGVGRFADVALGGALYAMAFKRWGFLGAVASHAAHNLAAGFGRWVVR